MAKKSSNEQGNPYHDETTGQFTSADSSSAPKNEEPSRFYSIRLKPNFDINASRTALQQLSSEKPVEQPVVAQNQQIGTYKEAQTIEEAIIIGKSIVPGCNVNYSSRCDITKVNEMNKALSDIANRFPGFVSNGLLSAYGDGISLNEEELKHTIIQSALNVIQNDKHFSKVYDEFFQQSKARYNLRDEDKFSPKVFNHFMGFDSQLNIKDYTKALSGYGVLAYYQVSMDNIYNSGAGGKGINGVVKFYPDIMLKPTQKEIETYNKEIKEGFHFDYGGHSYTYGTGVHELGHSIFTIAYKKCNDEEREELNQLLRDGTGKDLREVSGYGQNNFYEQEAEAVADGMCRGSNATPHNRKMMAWLDKVHKRLKESGEI